MKLGPELQTDLQLSFDATSPLQLETVLKQDFPDQVHGIGSARLKSNTLTDWSLVEIDADLSDEADTAIKLSGEIVGMPKALAYRLRFDAEQISTPLIKEQLKFSWPTNGQVRGSATLSGTSEKDSAKLAVERIIGSNGSFQFESNGDIASFKPIAGEGFRFKFHADDARDMPLVGESPALKSGLPSSGVGELRFEKGMVVGTLKELTFGKSDVSGKFSWEGVSDERSIPFFDLALESNSIDVRQLYKRQKKKRLFSTDPIKLDWLKTVEAKIVLNAARYDDYTLLLTDIKMDGELKDGVLSFPDVKAQFGGGELTGWLGFIRHPERG